MTAHELLYVHPYGHLNDLVVPAGALTCMNSVRVPKLGRYAFEVSDAEIRAATIVAVDVHWALATTGFGPLVQHVRSINPRARIIVGGITAGHYARDLLNRFEIDFVVRGDSENSFARLVEALLEGRSTDGIPNVFRRDGGLPTFERMSEADFDATDCLTADWFPTYSRVSGWDAVAFPQGRTIPVSRGCAFSCPECYGSYASTYGRGYLMRSPAGVVALLRRAQEMRLRNIRLFLAKPPANHLSALTRALAEAGPFRFESSVGFYLCSPPSPDDLSALDAAFDGQVAISMIPPDEHIPVLRPKRLLLEQHAWGKVAEQVQRSERLMLDVWTTARREFERTRDAFAAISPGPRVKVSFGAVWSVTRPTDTGEQHGFDTVREAVQPIWTFYLARLLSPALQSFLDPFAFLDELALDPETLTRPVRALGPFFDEAMENWRKHRLPTLPSLKFQVLPLATARRLTLATGGAHLRGRLARVEPPDDLDIDALADLEPAHDAAGIRLTGVVRTQAATSYLAFIPSVNGLPPMEAGQLRDLGGLGFVAVALPAPSMDAGPIIPMRVDILLRAQEIHVAVTTLSGDTIAQGRADLGYFKQNKPA